MHKLKICLDTSVLNFYYAKDSSKEMLVTRKLFEEIAQGKYEAFISDAVIREIDKSPIEISSRLKDLIAGNNIKILEPTEEADILTDEYIRQKIVPEKYKLDAYHIAASVINEIDVLVSWNFRHIVKLKTKNEVNGVNLLLGYRQIQICSPLEVIESED